MPPATSSDDSASYEVRLRRSALKHRLLGLAPPTVRFGDYELKEVVGSGGSGIVFRAFDERLRRPVALKLLSAPPGSNRHCSVSEARSLARVSHPNVVAVYEAGEHAGCSFLAMEYVEGESLRTWMHAEHGLGARLDVLSQAAAGLSALHAEGLVHGDFKPENALIAADGRLRIVDFGLSTADDGTTRFAGAGTRRYMAPEIRAGGTPTALADQYAFSKSALEVLDAGPQQESVHGTALTEALQRGMASDPGWRFANLEPLRRALAPPQPRTTRWILAVAALTLGVGAAVAFALTRTEPSTSKPSPPPLHCDSSTLASQQSRAVLEQSIGEFDAAAVSWPVWKPERRANALLMLGRWEEGCAFIDTVLARQDSDKLECLRFLYCADPSSLPRRARCFGGDVDSCRTLALVHEFEVQEALKGDIDASPNFAFQRAMLLEAATEGCNLGDDGMCRMVLKLRLAEDDAF